VGATPRATEAPPLQRCHLAVSIRLCASLKPRPERGRGRSSRAGAMTASREESRSLHRPAEHMGDFPVLALAVFFEGNAAQRYGVAGIVMELSQAFCGEADGTNHPLLLLGGANSSCTKKGGDERQLKLWRNER